MVHYRSHKCPPPVPILSQLDPVHTKSHVPFSLLRFHESISPGPRLTLWLFRNMLRFYGQLLAPRPTPKLEDHPLSDIRDCLFNISAATLHIGSLSSIRNLRKRHAVVTGTHLSLHGAVTRPPLYALMEWRGARLPFLPLSHQRFSLSTSKER